MKNQAPKVVLITGASSGFGKLTAEKLLERNYIVYPAARSIEKMRDLEKQGARILKMDVTDNNTVEAGVERIISEQGRIDILLSNAGYGTYGMTETVPMEELRYHYDVNVFGMARVLQAVLPHMRRRKEGRIVITTSLLSRISIAGLGWYASTKHALRAMSNALRQEVRDLGIQVVTIEPGAVKTGFDEVGIATLDKIIPPPDYQGLHAGFKNYLVNSYSRCPGPESTVKAMVKAMTAAKPKTVYKTTTDAWLLPRVRSLFTNRMIDQVILSQIKKAAGK